jgi:oligopeptide transport system substrate-binding protein
MARAGYGPDRRLGVSLRLRTSENERRVAVAAQSMWRQAWVDAELIRAETAVHYAELQSGNYDLALASWLAVYSDPQTFTLLLQSRTGPNNLGRFRDQRYDALTAQAAAETDLDRRARLLRKAEGRALELHGLIPVFHHAGRNLVAPAVRGWVSNALDVHRTRYLSLAR